MDRRELMLTAALGALAGPAFASDASVAPARSSARAAFPDPHALYRKLRFRSDDGPVFWWLQGPKLGQVGATLTPLYTNSVGTIQRIRHLEDTGFEVTQLEMALKLDLETGLLLKSWKNPYTGETLPMRFSPLGPTKSVYLADNSRLRPTEIGGAKLESSGTIYPPIIVGDDVFIRDETNARVFSPGRKTPFQVNDIAIYHGSLENLDDPAVAAGEATVFFAEVTGWQRWMKMGDRPGNLTSRLVGRKVAHYEDLPQAWRDQLAHIAPHIAEDPLGALDQPPARFER